ncbi:MAG: CPBP family intramembrane metalloprotease [Chloroflexota bacterium]|nr:MAG: CPBP family intramembrane metalloprotease [Chloroflexota bacterium]
MLGSILSLTLIGAAALTTLVAIDWRKSLQNISLLGLFLIILFLDNLILVGVNQYPSLLLVPNGRWGTVLILWSGKLYSFFACLTIVVLIRQAIPCRQLGLTLRQNERSVLPGLLVLLAVSLAAAWIGSGWDKGRFSLPVLIYMAIMPGLNEELVYRGLLLGILNRIKPPGWNLFGAEIGWGTVITALIFGLLHGFWVEPGFAFHFLWYPVVFSSVTGFLLAWQKERTGSLLIPVLSHGAIDFFISWVRMV